MKIVLTGSEGFIGSHLAEKIVKQGILSVFFHFSSRLNEPSSLKNIQEPSGIDSYFPWI